MMSNFMFTSEISFSIENEMIMGKEDKGGIVEEEVIEGEGEEEVIEVKGVKEVKEDREDREVKEGKEDKEVRGETGVDIGEGIGKREQIGQIEQIGGLVERRENILIKKQGNNQIIKKYTSKE